jgi:hypothetical protein
MLHPMDPFDHRRSGEPHSSPQLPVGKTPEILKLPKKGESCGIKNIFMAYIHGKNPPFLRTKLISRSKIP